MTGAYLAYAIDQARPVDDTPDWISSWLSEQPEVSWVFNPGKAFSVGKSGQTPDIREITGEALHRAGVVVAYLPRGTVSVGVPMEIDRAVQAGKQVLVISDAPSWMLRFSEPTVAVFPRWNQGARQWLTGALLAACGTPTGAELPVVVEEGSEMPRRGYDDDAGLDLVVSEARTIEPGQFVDIPCGVRVQLPVWAWGMITGRSSTLRKRGLMVNQGIIDTGYRGPLFAGVWNMTESTVKVEKGERIAQLLILHNGTRGLEPVEVAELDAGSRGSNGFGSTGT